MRQFRILEGDALAVLGTLAGESVQTCITSPPYWGLRDYGVAGQIGLERTPDEYVARLVAVFREVRRVLRADGTAWVNLGDSYAGGGTIGRNDTGPEALARRAEKYHTGTGNGSLVGRQGARPQVESLKPKDLVGIPWRVAFALQADGWYLRSDIIWAKPNPMPESVTDRPTKAHEYIFLLAKSERYFYDADAVREPRTDDHDAKSFRGGAYCHDAAFANVTGGNRMVTGETVLPSINGAFRNRRTVWTQSTQSFEGAHFATFPEELIRPCVLAGAPLGGVVLDPFAGSGTTGVVALGLDRGFVGIELNPAYAAMARGRIAGDQPLFNEEFDAEARSCGEAQKEIGFNSASQRLSVQMLV